MSVTWGTALIRSSVSTRIPFSSFAISSRSPFSPTSLTTPRITAMTHKMQTTVTAMDLDFGLGPFSPSLASPILPDRLMKTRCQTISHSIRSSPLQLYRSCGKKSPYPLPPSPLIRHASRTNHPAQTPLPSPTKPYTPRAAQNETGSSSRVNTRRCEACFEGILVSP